MHYINAIHCIYIQHLCLFFSFQTLQRKRNRMYWKVGEDEKNKLSLKHSCCIERKLFNLHVTLYLSCVSESIMKLCQDTHGIKIREANKTASGFPLRLKECEAASCKNKKRFFSAMIRISKVLVFIKILLGLDLTDRGQILKIENIYITASNKEQISRTLFRNPLKCTIYIKIGHLIH